MRILVTGASGFIGGPTCAALAARGHDVVALVRRPGSEPGGTRAVAGDLTDETSLVAAFREAAPDAVVHLAAENGAQRSEAKLRAANVGGLQHLIAACRACDPPPRVVFVSTVVTGDAHGALLTEDTDLPVQTAYGRSKQEGERMLADSGLDVVVVRPCHVYGAGGWFAEEIVGRLQGPGRFAVVGRGDNAWDMVHVDDLAAALALAAESGRPGEIYHCADDVPTTYGEAAARTASALGVGAPRRIPAVVARLAAGSGPIITVTRSARTSNAKLKAELGWTPQFRDSREGIPAVVAQLH
jgi:nucleoside-diphosphate-sugar epimerase